MAGYDGVDTWIPESREDKHILFDYLQQHEMFIVSHQHRAEGSTFNKFRSSFVKNLYECAEPEPVLINSHTGRDYFSLSQNLQLIDDAAEFSAKTGIKVAHETHRGRLGYSPQMTAELFSLREQLRITADLSHWVCVTESMLENFETILQTAIKRSIHIHARIGFEQGPQIAHPEAPEWEYAVFKFLGWWDSIMLANMESGKEIFTITTEFGPAPYMPRAPFSNKPLADLFEINCYMKDLLRARFSESYEGIPHSSF